MRTEHMAGPGFEHDEVDLHRRLADLESHIKNLQDAVTSHERIGVATGLLAHRFDCGAGRAWELLVRLSQTTNVKVRVVAQVLIDAHARQLSDADRDFADTLDRLLSHRPEANGGTEADGRTHPDTPAVRGAHR